MQWLTETIGTKTPELSFIDNSTPFSKEFDDVYFSKIDGLEESLHNFIRQHDFYTRWTESDKSFSILELGFGTGLNFLLTWKHWRNLNNKQSRLHYIACESRPIPSDELEKTHQSWPELHNLSTELIEKLPDQIQAFHRILFLKDNVELTLLYGEAKETLRKLQAKIDAFYLDGFSPKKNQAMWDEEIVSLIRKLANENSSLSTFSSSSNLRRNLQASGFETEKKKGFAYKREILSAKLSTNSNATSLGKASQAKKVIVIGAGLAGCSVAFSFCRRGANVHLIEEKDDIAQGSSGNLSAVIMPHISAKPDLRTRFSFSGFSFTMSVINDLEKMGFDLGYRNSAVLRIANSKRLETVVERLAELKIPKSTANFLSKEEASEILGMKINKGALHYPKGGFLNPASFCSSMLAVSNNLQTTLNTRITKIKKQDGKWLVFNHNDMLIDSAEILVIANSNSSLNFSELAWLPLEPVRGQVTHLPESKLTESFKSVLCYEGYISPAVNGLHVLGATYEHESDEIDVSDKKTKILIERLNNYLVAEKIDYQTGLSGRVGFRSSTPDRMPIVGKLNNVEAAAKDYTPIKYREIDISSSDNLWHENLFVSLGHGSQGVISCPISAELIASDVYQEPLPIDLDLVRYINPLRFQVREMNREENTREEN